jgi:hypothetical protein
MKVQHLPQYAIALAILVVALAVAGVPVSTLLVTLLVLACPLMMLLMMMGGLLGGRGGSQHGSQGGSDQRDRNSEEDHDHRPPSGQAVADQASQRGSAHRRSRPSTTHSTGDDADG